MTRIQFETRYPGGLPASSLRMLEREWPDHVHFSTSYTSRLELKEKARADRHRERLQRRHGVGDWVIHETASTFGGKPMKLTVAYERNNPSQVSLRRWSTPVSKF